MHLLDTNTCIDFINGRSEAVRQRLLAAAPESLAMSAITFAELSVGALRYSQQTDNEQKIRAFANFVAVLHFDAAAAVVYGHVARLIGLQRRSFDRLIAAHALALEATLVTNNGRDFQYIPGLKIENWTLPL